MIRLPHFAGLLLAAMVSTALFSAALIGTSHAATPKVVTLNKSQAPKRAQRPAGTKLSCNTPSDAPTDTCPALQVGRYRIWAFSLINNSTAFTLAAYDGDRLLGHVTKGGARYLNGARVDRRARRALFRGQGGREVALSFAEIDGLIRAGAQPRPGPKPVVAKRVRAPKRSLIERLMANQRPFYLRASDAPLYLHAFGGTQSGAHETLHPCPKARNHPNCQWVIERSPTTPGAVYLRSSGGPLYLHAHGGSHGGAKLTLHPCPKGRDHKNCQWFVERSPTRRGAVYLRSAGAAQYAHSHGGSLSGARNTLHPCPKGRDHGNCQWRIELR